jgi:hypothetical protein
MTFPERDMEEIEGCSDIEFEARASRFQPDTGARFHGMRQKGRDKLAPGEESCGRFGGRVVMLRGERPRNKWGGEEYGDETVHSGNISMQLRRRNPGLKLRRVFCRFVVAARDRDVLPSTLENV